MFYDNPKPIKTTLADERSPVMEINEPKAFIVCAICGYEGPKVVGGSDDAWRAWDGASMDAQTRGTMRGVKGTAEMHGWSLVQRLPGVWQLNGTFKNHHTLGDSYGPDGHSGDLLRIDFEAKTAETKSTKWLLR